MAYLILIRHGKSEWNVKGLWTGWTDIGLNKEGYREADRAAEAIKDIPINIVFTSKLKRAIQTWDEIKRILHLRNIPTISDSALNEKNYGDLTGKNKWNIEKEFGEKQFLLWRRSWDTIIPGGESLKNVYDRVVPYYKKYIVPELIQKKNVLISAHGNSLRALVKYLDNIPDDKIAALEIATGEVYVYTINEDGEVTHKEIRAEHKNTV